MFWNALLSSLKIFSHPEVFSLVLLMFFANLAFTWAIQRSTEASGDAAAPGCLTQILALLFQGVITGLFVMLLLPLLLRTGDAVSWRGVEFVGFVALRSGICAAILLSLVSFFPWVGRFLAGSPGLENFILAALTFRFLAPYYAGTMSKATPNFPGWHLTLFFALAAIVATKLVQISSFKILQKYLSNSPPWVEKILLPNLDIFAGILFFLAYSQALTFH